MKAVVVTPGKPGGGRLEEVPDPQPRDGEVLVQVHQVGLDGTDAEIMQGQYGEAPPGDDYLIIGHESLGRVAEATSGAEGLSTGDWVVAIVRRPDPVPCRNCAADEWDMCLNGRYTERGIKGRHGFLAEFYAETPNYLVSVPEEVSDVAVLLEPLSIVEKAVEQIKRIQSRLVWQPERAVVLGAGPIGLLAGMLLRLEGLEVHFYDASEPGLKRDLAEAAGANYIWSGEHKLGHELAAEIGPVDIVLEATGFSPLAFDAMDMVAPNGIVCLTGVSGGTRKLEISADHLNLEMVLSNKVIFGTVNANRRHFESGVRHLQEIESRWPGLLSRMITRRLPLGDIAAAFERSSDHVKSIVQVT
ncbi:MAG: glucose 1-dehydrogenase [Chloroflexi bacterium]|nr:glucose 1-dehydrogenase [Chloroflexota bacterium]